MDRRTVLIIGAGYTGLAAAYDLARAGRRVQILEADNDIGGLAGTFEISPGIRLEKFYHHWFSSDHDVLRLIAELGLADRLRYAATNTGLFSGGIVHRLAGPKDLLAFPGLPLIDRLRTGWMALHARLIRDWHSLEELSAEEWLIKTCGKRSYETIWRPLLEGKFGPRAADVSAVWIWNKLKLRGSSRSAGGSEQLIYMEGGFGAVAEAIWHTLVKAGAKVSLNTPVKRILARNGAVCGVETAQETIEANTVLATVPLPVFLDLAPDLPLSYSAPARQIGFLGNICLILRLKQRLSNTYWLNVAESGFPFVGVIQHTNLDSPENYAGEHIAYLSRYLPADDPMFSASSQELIRYCLPWLQKIFPRFSPEWIIGAHLWRARSSQPVITKGYSKLIPASQTPIQGLRLATMAQIYPQDRGTNYAVRAGRAAAARILSEGPAEKH